MVQKLLSVMETPFYLKHSVILYLVSEPHAKLKVRAQLIQGNQKLRLIGVKKRIRIISLLFKLIEEDKCQANTRRI